MSGKKAILVDLFEAQIEELDRISKETARSRAELIREAVTTYLLSWKKVLLAAKMGKIVD